MRQATQWREGNKVLSAEDGNQGNPNEDRKSNRPVKRSSAGADDVGKALRSAYDETLREDVPDDFLDLLGKLS